MLPVKHHLPASAACAPVLGALVGSTATKAEAGFNLPVIERTTMKVRLTSISIEVPNEIAMSIMLCPDPLKTYREMLALKYNIDPDSITEYDVNKLRELVCIELGERELKRLQAEAVNGAVNGHGIPRKQTLIVTDS